MPYYWISGIILLLTPTLALAQDTALTAEQALSNYGQLTAAPDASCVKHDSFNPDDIIVCAKKQGPDPRLPLPGERGPRDGARIASGDIPKASANRIYASSCGVQQDGRVCNGGLPVLSGVILAVKAIDKIIEGE